MALEHKKALPEAPDLLLMDALKQGSRFSATRLEVCISPTLQRCLHVGQRRSTLLLWHCWSRSQDAPVRERSLSMMCCIFCLAQLPFRPYHACMQPDMRHLCWHVVYLTASVCSSFTCGTA
jgi:hypothetical protein